MPFKSLAQVDKFRDLVKAGKISQADFDAKFLRTKNIDVLPKKLPMSK